MKLSVNCKNYLIDNNLFVRIDAEFIG